MEAEFVSFPERMECDAVAEVCDLFVAAHIDCAAVSFAIERERAQ